MLFRLLASLAARPPTESATMGNTPSTQTEQPASAATKPSTPRPEPERRVSRFDMIGGFNIEPAQPAPKRSPPAPTPPPLVQPERSASPPPRSATPAARTLWQQSPSYTRQPSRDNTPSPARSYEPYASRRRSTSISVSSSSTAVSTVSAAGAGGSSPKRATETLKRVNSAGRPVVEEVRPVAEEANLDSAVEVLVPQEKEGSMKEDKAMSPLTEEPEEQLDAPRVEENAEAPVVEKQPEEVLKVEEDAKPALIIETTAEQAPSPPPEERHVHFAGSPEPSSEEESLYQDAATASSSDVDLEDSPNDVPVVGSFENGDKLTTLAIPSRAEDDDPRTPLARVPPQLVTEASPTSPEVASAPVVPSAEDAPLPTSDVRPPTPPNTSHAISSPAALASILEPPSPSLSPADATADGAADPKVALPPSPLPLSLSLEPTPPKPKLALQSSSPTTPTTANSGTAGTPRTPVSAIALSHARLAHALPATLVHVRTPPPEGPIPLPATAILDAPPAPEEAGEPQEAAQAEAGHSPADATDALPEPLALSVGEAAVVHPAEEADIATERPAFDSSPVELRSDESPVELGTDARFDVPRLHVAAPAVPFPLLGSPMSPVEARAAAARLVGEAASPQEKAAWRETVYIEAEDGERSGWESDEDTEEGDEDREDREAPVAKETVHLDDEMQGGEGEVYEVINTKAGVAMDLAGHDGKSILGWEPHGSRNQQWVFNPWGKGFTIRSAWGGGYLGLEDGLDAGTELVVSDYPMSWRLEAIDGAENIFRIYWPNGKYTVGLEAGSNRVKLCSLTNLDAAYEWKFTRRPEREHHAQPVEPPRSPLSLPTPAPTPAPAPAPASDAAPEQATVSTIVTTRVQQDGLDLGPTPEGKQIVLGSGHAVHHHHGDWVEETTTTTTVTTVTTVRRKRC